MLGVKCYNMNCIKWRKDSSSFAVDNHCKKYGNVKKCPDVELRMSNREKISDDFAKMNTKKNLMSRGLTLYA